METVECEHRKLASLATTDDVYTLTSFETTSSFICFSNAASSAKRDFASSYAIFKSLFLDSTSALLRLSSGNNSDSH